MNHERDLLKLEAWLKTHAATAHEAAKHCPDLSCRSRKYVSGLCERLAAEGRTKVTEVPNYNRMGQYSLIWQENNRRDLQGEKR